MTSLFNWKLFHLVILLEEVSTVTLGEVLTHLPGSLFDAVGPA